ncbi:MAG: Trk system potassium transporter TrkA, partial [Deltaproteobacteria bacterium]|nr:Trk system potassium transporter TrkA [Deltaproteobacteria bacterium]
GLHAKIMDRDEERCRFLAERLNRTVVLHGDGTNQEALLEENVRGMDVVVTLTDKDEVNVLSSLLCRKLGAGMAVTRINKSEYVPLVRTIGLQHIVSPRLSAVNTILKYARKGRVISTVSIKDEAEALEAIALKNSAVVGKPIFDLPFPKGSIVLGIMRGDEVVIPTGSDTIQADDRLIILSLRGNIAKVEKALAVKLEQF